MATFSDFYNQQRALASQQASSSGPTKYDFSWLPAEGKSMSDPAPDSPLNTIIDLISRPLFGATTAVSGVAEGVAKDQEAGGGFLNTLGGIAAAPTNFLTGLVSTNTDKEAGQKQTFGDLMERYTDRFGEINNPDYVDREDNVAATTKGGLGLVADIALDPLSWIPGVAIAKGASLAGKGIKSAAKGVSAGADALKAGRAAKAGEQVVEEAAPVAETAVKVEDEAISPSDFITAPPKVPETAVDEAIVKAPDHLDWARAQKGSKTLEKLLTKLDTTDDVAKRSKLDDEILKKYEGQVKKDLPDTAVKVAEPEGFERFAAEFRAAPNAEALRATLDGVQNLVGSVQNVTRGGLKATDNGQKILVKDYNQFVNKAGDTAPEISDRLFDEMSVKLANVVGNNPSGTANVHADLLKVATDSKVAPDVKAEAQKLLRKEYFGAQRAADVTEQLKIADLAAAFAYRKGSESSRFNKLLGPLATTLEKKSPERLGELMPKILEVLDPAASDEVIQRFYDGRNMKQLGEDLRTALGVRAPYVKPVANTAEETAAVRARIPEMQTAADEAVAKTLHSEVTNAAQTYPHKSGNVRYSSLDEEVRMGRHTRQLNTFFQYTLVKNLRDSIYRRMESIKGVGNVDELKGARRAQAYRQAFLEAGDSVSESMLALGLKMHIGAGHQENLLPLNIFETYQLVERGFANEKMALAGLWNFGSAVAPTRLMEAVQTALTTTGKSADELVADVRTVLSNQKLTGKRGQVLDKNIPNNALSVKYGPSKGKSLVDPIAEAIVRALPDLQARLADNITNYAARGLDEASSLSNKELTKLKAVVGTEDYATAARAIAEVRKSVAASAEEIGAFPSSVQIAEDLVEATTGQTAVKVSKSAVAAENKVAAGEPRPAAVEKASQERSDAIQDELDEGFDEVDSTVLDKAPGRSPVEDDGVPAIDFAGMKADPYVAQNSFFASTALGQKLHSLFDQNWGMGAWSGLAHSKRTMGSQFLASTTNKLRPLANVPVEARVAAWNAVRTGTPNANSDVQAAAAIIEDVLSPIFGKSETLLDNVFLSVEKDIDHINAVLRQKYKGMEQPYQLDEAIDSWKDWDFSDPMRDLYKLADAAATVVEHRAIVGSFVKSGKDAGFVSTTAKPGFVRAANTGDSTFAGLIPEDVFIQREAAAELHRLDILTRTDRNLSGEAGEFLQKSFIPLQNIWKQLVTVYRPGHHVRNTMGNGFMQWIDRGNRHYLSSQKDAFRVLGIKNDYTDIDLVQALKSFTDDTMPTGGRLVVSGRFGDISEREMYEIAQRNGLFSTYASSEDLMGDIAKGAISRAGDALTNSKIGEIAGSVSHLIDHEAKLAHLIQILKQEAEGGRYAQFAKNLSKEKVIEQAIRQVKRAHPDAMMLTPFESKWRWLVPFYTWFAKTLPFAMESAVRNPGRIAAIPKASYALATSMGVNPDSLIDPFPDDQLFPSYLTEGVFGPQLLGPDGQYLNINPGVPQFDMAQSMMDPLSMISPLLSVPAELATGAQIGGGRINDTSDYLDQQLPIINYLANVTGTSVTGSIPSVLQGKGLDPQYQVDKGNKTGFDQALTFSNWFTGLNAQNWSRPNFINYAEIEKRNRENPSERSGF